ncbi:MAG: hypothetical protein IPL02_09210 [Moraxellaceae bacterium]|nr:hypothetical protein [Moraxellaceae bacterium]
MLSVTIGEASIQKELPTVFSETQLKQLRDIFKTLSNTTTGQTNERNQRRSTGTNQTENAENVSSNAERSTGTTSRNTAEDTGDEIVGGNRKTISSSERVPESSRSTEGSVTEDVEDGKVAVLQGVTEAVREEERSKPFSARNLIRAYFTQKKSDASNSPLVLVKDFISNLNVVSALSKYLSDDTKVNAKQVAQVEHFQKFAKNFAPVIARVFQGEFSKDPKNNLVRDLAVEGVLDESILTAIAVAAYGYLIRYSEPYNTDDTIRDIVRIAKDDTTHLKCSP